MIILALDLKIIVDLVINHSSDEHEWFKKSVKNIYPYSNYYLWADQKGYDSEGNPIPPNNWVTIKYILIRIVKHLPSY